MNELDKLTKELTKVETKMEKTLLEIGKQYSIYTLSQKEDLIPSLNKEVELFQKLETESKNLKEKISAINNSKS